MASSLCIVCISPLYLVIKVSETLADIVQKLDIKALPYVIFMVVPVLGRMSDSDDDIRSTGEDKD